MHRNISWVILLAVLYVSVGCSATKVPVAAPAPAAQPAPVVTAPAPGATPDVTPIPISIPLSANAEPHIALLLPLKSATFGRAAEVLAQGFMAANKVQPNALPIRVYSSADENKEVVALYRQALSNGAQAVVGPLTPAGVAALATQPVIPVPTLALNRVEGSASEKLYFFGLALESEARQIAHLATAADLHMASIVSSDTALSKRLVQAFSEEWKKQGGEIATIKIFNGDTTIFSDLSAEPGSMIFVAANAEKARMFRPYLNAVLPVYATSQIFNGNADTLVNYDLRDVVFVDMPWLLQPDHPAVMIYPRIAPPMEIDMERLYAMGVDAFRLLQAIRNNRTAQPLDGVTGILRLNANHQFEREAVVAEFRQGLGLTPEAFAALNAAKSKGGMPAANAPSATH